MFKLIEIWDNLAWMIYNLWAVLKYVFVDQFRFRRILKKNKELKDCHKGKRAFVVLNGPSINKLDISKITDEITICSNYFHYSELYDVVKPDYHCICDSDTFNDDRIQAVHDLMKKNPDVKYIYNKKAFGKLSDEEKKHTYFVYGMHFPTYCKIRDNLAGLSSSFNNVGAFCIMCAMYMGCKEIYVLGLDFAPGTGFTHCYGVTEAEKKVNNTIFYEQSREIICLSYWSYYLSHLGNFYLAKHAKKRGVKVYNVNKESYIRSFEFADYDELFKDTVT